LNNQQQQAINRLIAIFKLDIQRKSPNTLPAYMSYARNFLEFSEGDLSRHKLMQFFEQSGYCDNTLRTVHYALKRLYKSLGEKFPLDSDDLPPAPDEEELTTPTMPPDDIKRLVQYWRLQPDTYPTSLLFLSTMYGFRSIEMTDLEISKTSVVVHVAKKKRGKVVMREHPIPDGTHQFVAGYEHMSESMIQYTFRSMCHQAGVRREREQNWHSIRRSLTTSCVMMGMDKDLVHEYLRWAKDRSNMVSVYTHVPFAAINNIMFGKAPLIESDPPKYVMHPFLLYWTGA